MSSSDYPQGGVCEKCGMRTSIDDVGRTACDGCGKPTEHCRCEAAKV